MLFLLVLVLRPRRLTCVTTIGRKQSIRKKNAEDRLEGISTVKTFFATTKLSQTTSNVEDKPQRYPGGGFHRQRKYATQFVLHETQYDLKLVKILIGNEKRSRNATFSQLVGHENLMEETTNHFHEKSNIDKRGHPYVDLVGRVQASCCRE